MQYLEQIHNKDQDTHCEGTALHTSGGKKHDIYCTLMRDVFIMTQKKRRKVDTILLASINIQTEKRKKKRF